jgi:hypothetical protein
VLSYSWARSGRREGNAGDPRSAALARDTARPADAAQRCLVNVTVWVFPWTRPIGKLVEETLCFVQGKAERAGGVFDR